MEDPKSREDIKVAFKAGGKPTQQNFYDVFNSFIHKTEDGLAISEEGNLGVGTSNPQARLQVDGGLKIGDVPNVDTSQVVQGTLRWTGAELQIFFGGEWHNVWAPQSEPRKETYDQLDILVRRNNSPLSRPFNFPANASKLLNIEFLMDISAGLFFGNNNEELLISMHDTNGNTLWNTAIRQTPGDRTDVTFSSPVSGDVSIENLSSFILQFEVVKRQGGGGQQLTVNIKRITIQYIPA